jgi:hypothetical protein
VGVLIPGEVFVVQAEQLYSGNGGVGELLDWSRLMVTVAAGWPRFELLELLPQATISTLRRKRRKMAPHFKLRE